MREYCRQSQAQVVSKSNNKIHKTWGQPLAEPAIWGTSLLTMGVGLPAEWQLSVMGSPSATMRSEGCSRMTGGEWDCECGSSGWTDNRFELPKSSEKREERKQL